MSEFGQQLITIILAPTLVVGAVAWLLRAIISQGFQRDIERFKAEVKRKNDQQRERFLLIHNRRAEVIADLYSRLAKTKRLVGDLVAIFQQDASALPQKEQRVADAYNDAAEYFAQNRLFLPERTAEKADSMLDTLHTALIEFDTAQMGNKQYGRPVGSVDPIL